MPRFTLPLVLTLALLVPRGLSAQATNRDKTPPPLTRILFVFDGSQSMFGRWESGPKIDVAQRLIGQMLDSLQTIQNSGNFQLALRVYGHQRPVPPQDCSDTRLEVPFGTHNIPRIKKVLRAIQPKGTTPIAQSLMASADDFPPCDRCRNIIILITDGVEACDGDPCAVSRLLQRQGIVLKPFVIGIGIDENFRSTFECVGTYFDAADENTFKNVLEVVISQALDNTTAQINLLDGNNKPVETNVPILLLDHTSGKLKESFIHTLNYAGNPDTLILDPLVTYDMVVQTIPPVRVDSLTIAPGHHTHLGAKTPRGTLELRNNARNREPILCLVKPSGGQEVLHVQEFGTSQRYLAGSYDLEMLTLPRLRQADVHIDPSTTTAISIPPPGVLTLQTGTAGYGSILVRREWGLEWVIDLEENEERQVFQLLPGEYIVVFRSKLAQETAYSKSRQFKISSGSSTIVQIN